MLVENGGRVRGEGEAPGKRFAQKANWLGTPTQLNTRVARRVSLGNDVFDDINKNDSGTFRFSISKLDFSKIHSNLKQIPPDHILPLPLSGGIWCDLLRIPVHFRKIEL